MVYRRLQDPGMSNYPLAFYVRLFRLHLTINGLRWTICFSVRHALTEALRFIEGIMRRLETRLGLPGSNSVEENALKWNHYRWKKGENEWTSSEQWKQSVIDYVVVKNIPAGHAVLEIGPGFGRWTRKLIELSGRMIAVDVSEKCVAYCQETFADSDNAEFHLNDGRSLDFISDESIDYVWSFDVFVHIEPPYIAHYLAEFQRVLRADGVVIIHHGAIGRTDLNWRSSLTLPKFAELLEDYKFTLVEQFNSWGVNGEFKVAAGDLISIFRKS